MTAVVDASGTVEGELRQAKDTLKTLSALAEQAERGAMVDYDLAQRLMHEVSDRVRPLAQGTMNSFAGTTVVSSSGATLHARAGAGCSQNVTPLQRRRAEQVLSEVKLIEATLHRYAKKAEQQATYVSDLKSLVGNGTGAYRQNYEAMDHLEREKKSLQYARQRMQAMESESRDVLAALQDQGRRLGGVGNKLGNLLETLGVSNMTILQIVRRNKADAWLVYGGIALLLFFLWYMW
ncbi:putative SNARE protein [Leishmania major strain Friedlin]|uniref:Putative SNARE protein n=1 Tax=Leishmania major TaxID=5664 RepID=Q4QDE4_LEIMA|nr:putative SNARE protein [Leishmania major strain Friedlin]CAG9572764.1 SNARE_protein_-_putative [Leishmania major strain Friedlin]CAJ07162.1 putative SNARE protein [Leishmania major strain Friedlin]|eukprot:XP_001682654.1 putative SNARE protein [Leishmania major strain Friedlin]